MDLLKLDTQFRVVDRFPNHESLLWKEVYRGVGDFEMVSSDLDGVAQSFPIGTPVSIDDSGEVAIVSRMARSIDAQGRPTVTLSGKFAPNVFNHRPMLPIVASTSFLDAEYPDGWEFGDKLGTIANQDPRLVMDNIIKAVDAQTYGRTELSKLALPFSYRDWTDWSQDAYTPFRTLLQTYYSFDRSQTVMDALNILMDHGNFGLMTVRPGFNKWSFLNEQDLEIAEDRPVILARYRPSVKSIGNIYSESGVLGRGVMFADETADYLAVSHDQTYANTTTFGIDLAEDYVRTNDLDGPGMLYAGRHRGLNARVRLTEGSYAGLASEGLEVAEVLEKMAYQPWLAHTEENILDMELDGKYPFHDKVYEYSPEKDNKFYLGDIVGYKTPWTNSDATYLTQVVEFTRVHDREGYREFPRFVSPPTTSRPTVSEDGKTLTINEGDIRLSGYVSLLNSIQQHITWT